MTPDPDTVTATLTDHDGEATLGEIASALGAPPSAVEPTLHTLAEWGVVENTHGKHYRLTDADKRDATAAFDDRASDMPCPLGCGYRPVTGWDAFKHLLGHATGRATDGSDQLRNRDEYVR
jgi:predicted ArsR family transcriptional regulator